MKLLLLDIGNTYTKFTVSENDEINDINRIKTIDFIDYVYSDFNKFIGEYNLVFGKAIISSVVKNVGEVLMKSLSSKKIKTILVDHSLNYRVLYPKKNNELGGDLISLMEAVAKDRGTFIISSLGTASVIMLVKNYKFMGCAIAPGLLTSLNGLVSSASLIEDTKLDGEYKLLGLNSEKALRTGLLNGFRNLIDGFIDDIKEEYHLNKVHIYYFGGHAKRMFDISKYKDSIILDDNLLFKGLLEIYKLNGE